MNTPNTDTRKITVFDTTLRDGEQSPGCSMHLNEKLDVAEALEAMGVDVIEAGFPASSEGEFKAVREIASVLKRARVAALCRCKKEDIDRGYEAVKDAAAFRLHVFLATSPIHLEHKLRISEDTAIEMIDLHTRYARSLADDVEFSFEDATRTPLPFLARAAATAIAAGAGRIELCDNLAVGGTSPSYGVIRAAVAIARQTGAAVMAMARPRGGNFVYSADEEQMMLDDVAMARSLGVTGVVFGCLAADDATGEAVVDREMTARLVEAAHGPVTDEAGTEVPPVAVTFHMAFDELTEERQREAIDFLADLGVERILTHGGAAGTPITDNLDHLRRLIEHAAGRLIILPGGGITFENAESVAEALGVQEVHGTKIVKLG